MLRFSGSNIAFIDSAHLHAVAVGEGQNLVVVQHGVEVLDPDRVDGPSSTIHVLFFFSFAARRHSTAKTPSVQSPVAASNRPNICGAVIAFGFIFQMTCLVPSSVSAPASVSMMAVLPRARGSDEHDPVPHQVRLVQLHALG